MLKPILQATSWCLARSPEVLLRGASSVLGELFFQVRRRVILSNLHHAFPERDAAALRRLGRESARRMVETGMISLAIPGLTDERLRRIVTVTPAVLEFIKAQQTTPVPHLLAAPHLAYWEAIATFAVATPPPFPEIASIFRPMDNPSVDAWVKASRERHGIKLLSRKEGFQEAIRILRRNGSVFVLFDQNAGLQGALSTLFGRVCSTSELPGLLVQKHSARVLAMYAKRKAFWRVEIQAEVIPTDQTTGGVTLALNRWLEDKLRDSDEFCASWLWAHERWKNQDIPAKRLRLEAKRNLLAEDLAARHQSALPRRTRLWIRLPNWLGDVVMLIPLLRAIRQGRPDAELTLVGKSGFAPLLQHYELGENYIALPARGRGYFARFKRLAARYPDCTLLFTNSLRGDVESWLTGSPQRFGIKRPGKPRPLLTHSFAVPTDYNEAQHHQLELWNDYLKHFGLTVAIDTSPLDSPQSNVNPTIGLIAGSENNPEKRWPVRHWCELIDRLPSGVQVVLFGTANDRAITNEIAARCERTVENLAGRTDLAEYCAALKRCTALVTNDTGGMHLANALGVPLVALFGPTNPVRTKPVFAAPVHILQPPGCAPTGGGKLDDLSPAQVLAVLQRECPVLGLAV